MNEESSENRTFIRGEKVKYSLKEKHDLGTLVKKYKEEYNETFKKNRNKISFNDKLQKHT